MKTGYIHLPAYEIRGFIERCWYEDCKIRVRNHRTDSEASIQKGHYSLKLDGRYNVQLRVNKEKVTDMMEKLIWKYKRFEYDGRLYHYDEYDMWQWEEL